MPICAQAWRAPPKPHRIDSARMITLKNINHRGTNTLLLAEDHDICRRITVGQLDKLGVSTIAVADGELAFRAWLEHRPSLVISDYRLPGLNGHALARRIRACEQEERLHAALECVAATPTTLILLSVTMTPHDIEAGLNVGFDECLNKPLLGNALVRALARWGIHQEKLK